MIIGKRRAGAKHLKIGAPLRSRRRLSQQLRHITTFVVDSPSLIKNTYQFNATWSLQMDRNEIIVAAHNALIATEEPRLQLLKNSLPLSKNTSHAPIDGGSQVLSWSTWHHGGDYTTFWCGDVTTMLHHANLTDTEREQLMLEARKAISRGLIAYAVGSSLTPSIPSRPEHNIERLGLIFVKPTVYPGIETALQQIKAHGITVMYVSSDDTYTATAIAHLTGLAAKDDIALTLTAARMQAMHSRLYAGSTTVLRKRLIASYPPDSLAVVSEPLPEFWRSFRAALS